MKISFSTLGCPEWSFSDIVSVASDLGYNGIEIRGIQNELFAPSMEPFSGNHIEDTKKTLARLSLEIPCLTSACNLNEEGDIEKAKAYIDTASALGTPYIRVLGDLSPAPSADVSLKEITSNLEEIADYGKSKNVMPLVETNGFFAKTKSLGAMLKSFSHPNVGILFDINHPYRFFGEEPAYTIDNLGPFIKHVHIKDSVMEGKSIRYKMVGEGDLPVAKTIKLLEKAGFDGYYSLEWVKRWDLSLEEPGIAFAQYMEFMETL